jgi:plastocyanin
VVKITLLFAALALVLIVACGGQSLDDVQPERSETVTVRDSRFEPRVIEVRRGATVTWNWQGSLVHNVVGEGWSSQLQDSGSFQHRFEGAGTVDYRCTVHPGMTGRIIVTE